MGNVDAQLCTPSVANSRSRRCRQIQTPGAGSPDPGRAPECCAPVGVNAEAARIAAASYAQDLAILLGGYALLALPAYWGPSYLESMSSFLVMVPLLSIYIFHKLGIPGLLEHDGACGWGWCAPTVFGWAFLVMFWTGVAWLIAWGLACLTTRSPANGQR